MKKLTEVLIDESEAIMSVRKEAKKGWEEAKQSDPEAFTDPPTLLIVCIAIRFPLEYF